MSRDTEFMNRAIRLARASEEEGNLPVGAVIVLDGRVIGEGYSAVVEPTYDPGRHAEIEALDDVETELWPRASEMTCYTTLEPCVMCAGTLLLHGIGRVVFGARDELGGAGKTLDHLPPFYDEAEVFDWEGPLMPTVCRPLAERTLAAFDELPVGRGAGAGDDASTHPRERLEAWRDGEAEAMSLTEAREAVEAWAERLRADELDEVLPYAAAIFERGGYVKDFRALKRYARRAGHPEFLERVDETLRRELPDIWIRRALERGHREAAVECWFEHEEHRRARHVADELVEACEADRTQVIISCRLARVTYLVERGGRRRYRRACDLLRKLRDELERAGESMYWRGILDELETRYDNRPAWLDEMEKAGF